MTTLIYLTQIFEFLILGTLILLSVWSVSIMIDRRRRLKQETSFDFGKLKAMIDQKDWSGAQKTCAAEKLFISQALLQAFHNDSKAENVDRAVSSYVKEERLALEKGLSVLATLGANAAFVGLLGTVLGIIRAFAYLGSQSGSQAVMTGVSQALYATAIGLFVAIPAVVAYNIFSRQVREQVQKVDSLKDLFIAKRF